MVFHGVCEDKFDEIFGFKRAQMYLIDEYGDREESIEE